MTGAGKPAGLAVALAVAGATATVLVGGASAKPGPKKVKVGDNFFLPAKPTVAKGTTISWRWLGGNGETHDVLLVRKPKGVKKFQSAPAATEYTFRRKLTKPGKYFLVCTYHEEMTMNIKVKG